MATKKVLAVLLSMLLLAGSVLTGRAGGWATIELTEPITNVAVGDVVALNIVVLQHGMTPSGYDNVIVTASHADSNTSITVDAIPDDKDGYFVAELTFAQDGRWKIRADIPEYGIGSAFPTLYVVADDGDHVGTPLAEKAPDIDVVEVNIVGGTFDPALTTIEVGTTVRFTNGDTIKHEVAFADMGIDDSGILEPGETFDVTFTETGEFVFVCGPHPGMTARIVVE